MKYFLVYGYNDNPRSIGGDLPILCVIKARNKRQAEDCAEFLEGYTSVYYGKGYVEEITVINADEILGDNEPSFSM